MAQYQLGARPLGICETRNHRGLRRRSVQPTPLDRPLSASDGRYGGGTSAPRPGHLRHLRGPRQRPALRHLHLRGVQGLLQAHRPEQAHLLVCATRYSRFLLHSPRASQSLSVLPILSLSE
ncbi:hypothetical protein PFISCL1PPCAC_22498 [Pristionchus fissidentatus]|uniref:G protein-coupled receptor n=1 Tax=Pristionchus fissidentatus TaxID=1538716 RepID=A0AAV5WG30_9BILA|nr:hypothetical protein PFISCL1PPCAC_22498 [Pristionchus fissidentatus]